MAFSQFLGAKFRPIFFFIGLSVFCARPFVFVIVNALGLFQSDAIFENHAGKCLSDFSDYLKAFRCHFVLDNVLDQKQPE